MATYDTYKLNRAGLDLLVIVVEESFSENAPSSQRAALENAQKCAIMNNISGTVAFVWPRNGQNNGVIANSHFAIDILSLLKTDDIFRLPQIHFSCDSL